MLSCFHPDPDSPVRQTEEGGSQPSIYAGGDSTGGATPPGLSALKCGLGVPRTIAALVHHVHVDVSHVDVRVRSLYVCTRLSSPASFGQSPSAERPDQPSGFAYVSEASKAYLSFDTAL